MRRIFIISLCLVSVGLYAKMDYKDIDLAYKKSYRYERGHNLNDAIKALMVVVAHYPKAYTVNLRLGHLYSRMGKNANSIEHYKIAQKALPLSLSPQLGLLAIQIAQHEYGRAETIGFNIIKKDFYNYYGNLNLAHALIMLKKYDSAQELITKILTIYPEDVLYLVQQGLLYTKQKKISLATDTYSNILILDPENVSARLFFSYQPKSKKE